MRGAFIPLPYCTDEFCDDERGGKKCGPLYKEIFDWRCRLFDKKIELYFARPMRCDECKESQKWDWNLSDRDIGDGHNERG